MKNADKNQMKQYRILRRYGLKKRLSAFLALLIVISMLSGQLAFIHGAETDSTYALAGVGSGEDVTIHFGDSEDQDISIHVNPETNEDTLAGYGSEALGTETEAETEAEAENTGLEKVEAGDLVTISSVDGSLLPEEAEASAEILSGRDENTAVEKVEEVASVDPTFETTDPVGSSEQAMTEQEPTEAQSALEAESGAVVGEKAEYQAFDISLENVDEEQYQDGFKVEVSLPEDVTGRDFRLYHIHEGEDPVEIPVRTVGTVDPETGLEVVSGFEFKTDGFSEFVLQYTVDFYYGDYEFHIPGEGYILLSRLFDILHIDADAAQAVSVEFTNPSLLAVYNIRQDEALSQILNKVNSPRASEIEAGSSEDETLRAEDWLLVSLAPFKSHETLTITMADGMVYVIRVEDAQTDLVVMMNDWNAGYFTSGKLFPYSTSAQAYSFITDVDKVGDQIKGFKHIVGSFYGFTAESNADYSFCYWIKIDENGTVTRIGKETVGYDDLRNPDHNNLDGVTLIAFFKPTGQHLIRFDAESNNGSISQNNNETTHYVHDYLHNKTYGWAYSGEEAVQAKAKANNGYKVSGWWDQSGNRVTTSDFISLDEIDQDMVYTAKFNSLETYTINYISTWYYTNIKVNNTTYYAGGPNGASASENVQDGNEAMGATADSHGNPNDPSQYSYFIAWIDEEGRAVCNDKYFKPVGDQIRNATYTAVFSSSPTYVVLECDYHAGSVGGVEAYYNTGQLDLKSANKKDHIVLAQYNNNGKLLGDLWPVPKEGYEFSHWEWTPENGSTVRINDGRIVAANNSTIQGKGVLKAVFKPLITYDIGQINWVGVNSPDFQHWYTANWCPEVTVPHATKAADDENIFTELPEYGANYTIRNVSGQTRVTQTNNGYNLLTHYFTGWKANRDLVINGTKYSAGKLIPANVVNDGARIDNVTEAITFTAVWSSTFPGKTEYNNNNTKEGYRYNTNSVGFFVRLFDSVFDIGDTNTYTDCLFATRLTLSGSGTFTQGSSNGTRFDFFGNSKANVQSDINAIDAALRSEAMSGLNYSWYRFNSVQAYQGHDGRYDNVTITLDNFPSDDMIFARIRAWNLTAPQDRKIQISGHKIDQDMITSDFFDIKWYVLKDQQNQWHIDGMLIPKYAKLRATKQFIGLKDAFANAKNNYTITVTETNPRQNTGTDTHVLKMGYENGTVTWTYTMNGTAISRKSGETGTTWTFEDSGNLLARVSSDASGNNIAWSMHHLRPLTAYSVVESGYESEGYAVTTSHVIQNTPQTTNLTGGASATVDRVYNYAQGTSESSYQTVAFTNLYTEPWVMTIFKQDGNTLHGLKHVTFDLEVKNSNNEVVSGIPTVLTTNADGQISVPFPHEAGNYSFKMTERAHEGYSAITTITGSVTVANDGAVEVSNLQGGVTGENAMVTVDNNNKAVVYIKNTPERVKVKVQKEWTEGTTPLPVTMQLMRNGVPMYGYSVVLGAAEAAASPYLKVTDWEYSWNDLPAYVDGKEVVYTAREEWIGEPGGEDSIHYSLSNDSSDGYAEYIVYQTQTKTTEGDDLTVITVKMENTKDDGQLVFTKVDIDHKPVEGAVFEIFDIINGVGQNTPRDKTYTSNSEGVVNINDLPLGDYWLRERTAPVGFDAGDRPFYLLHIRKNNSVMLANDGSDHWSVPTAEIVNEPFTAHVKVIKEGEDGEKLSGAVFSLHRTETGDIPITGYASLISDGNGEIDLGELKQGTYWLKEITAPKGYQMLTKRVAIVVTDDRNAEPVVVSAVLENTNLDVDVEESSETYSVHVVNESYPIDIKVEKVEAGENRKPLNGVVFKLAKAQNISGEERYAPVAGIETSDVDEQNQIITTDERGYFTVNGNITLMGLKNGKYTLEEVSAPAGYLITNRTPVTFTVKDGKVVVDSNDLAQGVEYTAKSASVSVDTFTIPNTPGAVLPATGGSGTNILYLLGSMLLLFAGAGYVLLKRRKKVS